MCMRINYYDHRSTARARSPHPLCVAMARSGLPAMGCGLMWSNHTAERSIITSGTYPSNVGKWVSSMMLMRMGDDGKHD